MDSIAHGLPSEASSTIYCENQSAIKVVNNLFAHRNTKHIELHPNYLRHLVQEKVFTLVYYRIDDQIVDVFMNPL